LFQDISRLRFTCCITDELICDPTEKEHGLLGFGRLTAAYHSNAPHFAPGALTRFVEAKVNFSVVTSGSVDSQVSCIKDVLEPFKAEATIKLVPHL
jgi:hypothetical protein